MADIAKEFKDNYLKYREKAVECTEKNAMKKPGKNGGGKAAEALGSVSGGIQGRKEGSEPMEME
jgi:hypothetical protein